MTRSAAHPLADASHEVDVATAFACHGRFVFRALRGLGVADRDVDDLVQEVFVVAFRRWHVLQPDANVPAWLYQIARRVAKDHRSSSNARVAREAAVPEPPSTTVDEAVDRERAAAFVESFIETLPDGQRQAFVLAEIEGWTAPEIAEAEGVKLATVYSRIRLAREALRAAVERRRQKPAGGT